MLHFDALTLFCDSASERVRQDHVLSKVFDYHLLYDNVLPEGQQRKVSLSLSAIS